MKPIACIKRLKRPAELRIAAMVFAALLLSLAAIRSEASKSSPEENFKATTVFLVRHAEKAVEPAEDPPLVEAGNARAEQLAMILSQAGIKTIYTSQFLRTKQTAEPLAKLLGISLTTMPIRMNTSNPRQISMQSLKEISDRIYERAGESALVVGHSNTIPEVIRMLGGDIVPTIDEKVYDDLFIVTVYAKGKAKVTQLKYEGQK